MNWLDFNNTCGQTIPHQTLDTEAIRTDVLHRLQEILFYLFPSGRIANGRFYIGNVQGNKGKSLIVDLQGSKAGCWHDFSEKTGGDIFALWSQAKGFSSKQDDFPKVLESISEYLGTTPKPLPKIEKTPPTDELGAYTAKWDYHDKDGKLIACVYRYDPPSGKEFRLWDVVKKKASAPSPRPLYQIPLIVTSDTVIIVEGEKCADSLISQGVAATTAMNGANAPLEKTDWSPLTGKQVIIWPDNDNTGREYAEKLSSYLVEQKICSPQILTPPTDKPVKWDAADAVSEGFAVRNFIKQVNEGLDKPLVSSYTVGELLDDTSPMPEDLISPRILTPGGLLVFGGAPKVGKSDFLLSLLMHMASGISFLGMKPKRPMRIFYLQAEIGYHYLRERLKTFPFAPKLLPMVRKNLVITPQCRILLNEEGVKATSNAIHRHFDEAVDIIVVDPLRNVFDGGESEATENDNGAMLFFLQQRLEVLRDLVNPNAGIILVHHTRKIEKRRLEEEPFQALSGASSLRGYYTSGMIMFQGEETSGVRQLHFELRNGPKVPLKMVDKVDGVWQEVEYNSNRLVNRDYGQKLDAERRRKRDVILQIVYEEARASRVYTMNQFCQAFENRGGLGGKETIRGRLDVLSTKGYIKFFKDAETYNLNTPARTKYGFLCVEDMHLGTEEEMIDPHTGEVSTKLLPVYPTHYKCRQTAAVLPVENPRVWIYDEEEEG